MDPHSVQQTEPQQAALQPIPNNLQTSKPSFFRSKMFFIVLFVIAIIMIMAIGSYFVFSSQKQVTHSPVALQPTVAVAPSFAPTPLATSEPQLWQPICNQESDTLTTVTVHQGDGITNIARRAITNYLNAVQLDE